ncbi:MAG: TrkA family potassium uptake protein [Erysipelotrichaceae bacterium]|nr:TrkA family potassium uptake protein [Erysipelotrichaceae bacterium]
MKNRTTYGIIGIGRFGASLAQELLKNDADIMVIDKDPDKIKEFREYTDNAFIVSSLDTKSLLETGIQNVDVAVVCIGEQLDVSILAAMSLVNMGIPKVIAKASSEEHGTILKKIGAEIVYPERDMAIRLANSLQSSKVIDFIQLNQKINIIKYAINGKFYGLSIRELDIRRKFGLNIIAIENTGEVIENVFPEYVFKENDILFMTGTSENIAKLNKWAAQ